MSQLSQHCQPSPITAAHLSLLISLLQRDAESVVSVDPDRITRKNQDRLRKLKAIAGDDISVDDPDDIIDRFMTRQNHNRY